MRVCHLDVAPEFGPLAHVLCESSGSAPATTRKSRVKGPDHNVFDNAIPPSTGPLWESECVFVWRVQRWANRPEVERRVSVSDVTQTMGSRLQGGS